MLGLCMPICVCPQHSQKIERALAEIEQRQVAIVAKEVEVNMRALALEQQKATEQRLARPGVAQAHTVAALAASIRRESVGASVGDGSTSHGQVQWGGERGQAGTDAAAVGRGKEPETGDEYDGEPDAADVGGAVNGAWSVDCCYSARPPLLTRR